MIRSEVDSIHSVGTLTDFYEDETDDNSDLRYVVVAIRIAIFYEDEIDDNSDLRESKPFFIEEIDAIAPQDHVAPIFDCALITPDHIAEIKIRLAELTRIHRIKYPLPSYMGDRASLIPADEADSATEYATEKTVISLKDVREDRISRYTSFISVGSRDIRRSAYYLNLAKVKELIGVDAYRCIDAAYHFVRVGPFIHVGVASPNCISLDSRQRMVIMGSRQPAVCIMIGAVQECHLTQNNVKTGDEVPVEQMNNRHIKISPCFQTAVAFRSILRKVFARDILRVPFVSESEIVFSTKKLNTARPPPMPMPVKNSRMYGLSSGHIKLDDHNSHNIAVITRDLWYNVQEWRAHLDFHDIVPIFDATKTDFLFTKDAFSLLRDLPRFPGEVPSDALVAVAFSSSVVDVAVSKPLVILGIQFVIVLRVVELPENNN
ncbi:hypothetical protein CVT24_010892 [Panaeolus cyanescens]|uniref:Uncharacterized protein n=1 Tax=Panaeolus cyanescens TaxID=181874 RepID=A0A409YVF8_9AGAR|nr:hypothetical protein CVT24_010892 [Panaeolus cyanescens]